MWCTLRIMLPYTLLIIFISACNAERILVYTPLPFYSHQITFNHLWKELANRGHNLTIVTLNPMEYHENITQIDLSDVYKVMEKIKFYEVLSTGEQNLENVFYIHEICLDIIDQELSDPKMRDLINGDERFDLVMTEFYVPIGTVLAHKYNCPVIGFVSIDVMPTLHYVVDNPVHSISYPNFDLGFHGTLTFMERVISTIFDIFLDIYTTYYYFPKTDILMRKHFGNEIPVLNDLVNNISILFTNTHPIFHSVRPLSPQTINVGGGGVHIQEPKLLPTDIQEFLDESESVIYFSLGSTIRSSSLSVEIKLVLIETFSQLPYKIIWKFEKGVDDTFDIPNNVRIFNWLPQQDLLRHPNIKLFITQGGLQSLEEALLNGVPVLILPFFGDQILNAKKVVENGFGLSLNHRNLETSEFKNTILELITSSKYKESAMRLSKQLLDQPMTGVQSAAWWTEYVLRNPNIDLLKNPNAKVPFYQYYYLDIVLFFICICVALIYCVKLSLIAIFYIISSLLLGRKNKTKKE